MCPGSEASHTVNADVGGTDSCSNIIITGGHNLFFSESFLLRGKGVCVFMSALCVPI